MSHKADSSFFDEKKVWSEKKDQILSNYLTPYLAKVKNLRKPILIVDAFAGRGKFRDGNHGSPLIICEKAKSLYKDGTEIRVVCIEQNENLHASLQQNLKAYDFAKAVHGSFLEYSDKIASSAKLSTVFLYLDPYNVHSLEWEALTDIARHIHTSKSSVEILLNFQAPIFVRCGWQALKQKPRNSEILNDHLEDYEKATIESSSKEKLNRIVGGDWWQGVLSNSSNFAEQVQLMVQGFRKNFTDYFPYYCHVPIGASGTNAIPKYFMVFGTGHPDGLHLMKDQMEKSRTQPQFQAELFQDEDLKTAILDEITEGIRRGELITKILARQSSNDYATREIRNMIYELRNSKKIRFPSGKAKISDEDIIERM